MNRLNGDLGCNNLEARRREPVRELAPNGTFWHSGKKILPWNDLRAWASPPVTVKREDSRRFGAHFNPRIFGIFGRNRIFF